MYIKSEGQKNAAQSYEIGLIPTPPPPRGALPLPLYYGKGVCELILHSVMFLVAIFLVVIYWL